MIAEFTVQYNTILYNTLLNSTILYLKWHIHLAIWISLKTPPANSQVFHKLLIHCCFHIFRFVVNLANEILPAGISDIRTLVNH